MDKEVRVLLRVPGKMAEMGKCRDARLPGP